MEVEDELVEGDSLVDWSSPLIYDIYPNEEDLVEEGSVPVDTIKIVQEIDTHYVFDESPNGEVPQWGLDKINYVDFLGVENFLSTFPNQNLDVGFGMLEEKLILYGREIIDPYWEVFMEWVDDNK